MKTFNIFGFAGSLRKHSFNRGLLAKAREILPDSMELDIFSLDQIPLYNDDLQMEALPEALVDFRRKISAADALLIASPEYNYSMTGVLKNAIDWASSNTFGNILSEKIIAIMGASRGLFGTTRGQMHLRQSLHAMNARPLARPEVFVRSAPDLFDGVGNLIDAATIERIRGLLNAVLEELNQKEIGSN